MSSFSEKLETPLGYAWVILIFGFGFVQIYAAYLGIDYHWGVIWAVIIIGASLFFRFIPAITIGAFFGALDVWEWHWFFSLIFAAPSLIFVVPGLLAHFLDSMRTRFGKV